MDHTSIALSLAEWCSGLTWAGLPAQQQTRVVDSLVDTIGVAMAGTLEPGFDIAQSFIGEGPGAGAHAETWGTGARGAAAGAAFLNGAAGHLMDFDDVHYSIHGHPSTVLYPALLAAAQEQDLPLERVLVGYVAGIGVMAAVSRAYGPRHYSLGWHSTSTCGAIGAAAAVGTALGLGADRTRAAISIAVSLSGGVRANFGTLMKPFHAGFAARAGLEAATLASLGTSAAQDALTGHLGGVDVYGDGSWPGTQADPRESLLEAARNGLDEIGLKLYPCCRGSHYAIDASLEVREALADPLALKAVHLKVPLGTKTALIYDDPQTGLEAKFSLPYAVATSLAHGTPEARHFADGSVFDPLTRDFMDLLTVEEDASNGDLSASMDGRYATVEAVTTTGEHVVRTVDDARGSWSRPLTAAEIDGKFLSTAGLVLAAPEAQGLLSVLRTAAPALPVRGLFSGLPRSR